MKSQENYPDSGHRCCLLDESQDPSTQFISSGQLWDNKNKRSHHPVRRLFKRLTILCRLNSETPEQHQHFHCVVHIVLTLGTLNWTDFVQSLTWFFSTGTFGQVISAHLHFYCRFDQQRGLGPEQPPSSRPTGSLWWLTTHWMFQHLLPRDNIWCCCFFCFKAKLFS